MPLSQLLKRGQASKGVTGDAGDRIVVKPSAILRISDQFVKDRERWVTYNEVARTEEIFIRSR